MTVYNILFPFLILTALGVAVFILVRHLGDVPTLSEKHVTEEKKRWWQILLGKGEGFLKILRTLLLRVDNKLSDSIQSVREKKNDIGRSLKDYTQKKRDLPRDREDLRQDDFPIEQKDDFSLTEKPVGAEPLSEGIDVSEGEVAARSSEETLGEVKTADPFSEKRSVEELPEKLEEKKTEKKPIRFRFSFGKEKIPVQEIVKKTFTADELKNERKEYWKKKESMLIQSIVREPKNVNLFLQLGRLYCNQKNWEDAKNAFYEVLKLDRMNIKAKEELKRIEKNESKD